jgi:transposase
MLIPSPRVYLSAKATDLRKSYRTLCVVVKEHLEEDPLSGSMFVFYNRSGDLLKILYWYVNGFCLWQKRLEKGRFKLSSFTSGCSKVSVTSYQLQGLMQGLDCWQVPEAQPLFYSRF